VITFGRMRCRQPAPQSSTIPPLRLARSMIAVTSPSYSCEQIAPWNEMSRLFS
jgi:hypothetical protein